MDLDLLVGLLILLAVTAGFVGALTGLGGGVVVIPALVILFGVPIPEAIGTGAITILATSTTTGAAYVRDRLSDLRIGMFLEVATVPGALLGATATVFLIHASLQDALLIAVGIVFLATIPGSLARRNEEVPSGVEPDARSQALGLSGEYHDQVLGQTVSYTAAETTPALGVMFGAESSRGCSGSGAACSRCSHSKSISGCP